MNKIAEHCYREMLQRRWECNVSMNGGQKFRSGEYLTPRLIIESVGGQELKYMRRLTSDPIATSSFKQGRLQGTPIRFQSGIGFINTQSPIYLHDRSLSYCRQESTQKRRARFCQCPCPSVKLCTDYLPVPHRSKLFYTKQAISRPVFPLQEGASLHLWP